MGGYDKSPENLVFEGWSAWTFANYCSSQFNFTKVNGPKNLIRIRLTSSPQASDDLVSKALPLIHIENKFSLF